MLPAMLNPPGGVHTTVPELASSTTAVRPSAAGQDAAGVAVSTSSQVSYPPPNTTTGLTDPAVGYDAMGTGTGVDQVCPSVAATVVFDPKHLRPGVWHPNRQSRFGLSNAGVPVARVLL